MSDPNKDQLRLIRELARKGYDSNQIDQAVDEFRTANINFYQESNNQGSFTDEELDIIVLHSIKKLLIFPIFFTIYIGKHRIFKKYVFFQKAKHIKAEFTTPQIAQADGETYYDVTSIETMSSGKQIHLRS